MSVATLVRSGLSGVKGRRTKPTPFAPWVRPADWLGLHEVAVGDKKLVGLYAVHNHDSNFVSFSVAGSYTVDWGDGSATENFASGAQANHNYVFSALSAGTLTSEGFRQALITVTMQGASNLTSVNLYLKHSQAGLTNNYSSGWLDIKMASANCSLVTIGNGVTLVSHKYLQRFEFVGPANFTATGILFLGCSALREVAGTDWSATLTNFTDMFNGCTALASVPQLNTAAGTNFTSMFNGCGVLKSIPLLNTAAGTNFTSMFSACAALRSIPLLNTASGTLFASMFNNCASLQTIPLLNTAIGTSFASMFANCNSLQSVPPLNTAAGTSFVGMFSGCGSLRSVPLLNTGLGTLFNSMFQNCYSLQTVPLLNTASGTNFTSMFNTCASLQTVPLFNTAAGVTFTSMFQACYCLKTIPLINTALGTTFSNMFNSCSSLQTVPLLNTAAGITFSGMFTGCTALQTVPLLNTAAGTTGLSTMFGSCPTLSVGALAGTTRAISYASCRLSATELNRIYTNLGTAAGAQAITVTGNYGTSGDDPTIATAKGWTVTGS